MNHKKDYRSSNTENKPGVYVFRDRFKKVIYVGKAKSLRKRLSNYFQPSRQNSTDLKLRSLIKSIVYYELFPVRTEEEAMLLESRFIKEFSPRYNVVFRDDKRFLLLKIDIHSPFPKLSFARLKKEDGHVYFGPFPQAGILRDTIHYLNQYFGLRSCPQKVPGEREHKHCLDHIVRYCSAPCVGKIGEESYHLRIQQLIDVIEGNTKEITATLSEKMNRYAEKKKYESAAKMRDIIDNIRTIFASQNRTFARRSLIRYPGPEAVDELADVLGLNKRPAILECFDISNISGSFAVGSMVCFIDGSPARKEYRHFHIKNVSGIDDFSMMREVVNRRYHRLKNENNRYPDLIIVDGGLGQLHASVDALKELNLQQLPIVGLAKKHEEIFTLHSRESIKIEHHKLSLKLLQAIRDEAHRFANTFHQKLRNKRIRNSLLDEIAGIGEKRKKQLLTHFGSVNNLRRQSAEQIARRMPGIGNKLATEIITHLNTKLLSHK